MHEIPELGCRTAEGHREHGAALAIESAHGIESPRRRHHGVPERLGRDAARRRGCSKDFGVAHESRVVSAHRTPDAMFEYAEEPRERGLALHHRRRGRCGAPARHDRLQDHDPGARRSGAIASPRGAGFALLHRADAQGHPGGDVRHRRSRRGQRGPLRREPARHRRRGARPQARASIASACASRWPRCNCPTSCDRSRAPRSASWAAASSAGCSRVAARTLGYRVDGARSRSARARGRVRHGRTSTRRYTDPDAPRAARRAVRRRHDRIRERSRRRARCLARRARRPPVGLVSVAVAQDRLREKGVLPRARLSRRRLRRRSKPRPTSTRRSRT